MRYWCRLLDCFTFYIFLFAIVYLNWRRFFSFFVFSIIFIILFIFFTFFFVVMLFMLTFFLFLMFANLLTLLLLAWPKTNNLYAIFLYVTIQIDLLNLCAFYRAIRFTGWLIRPRAWVILTRSTAMRRVSFRYLTLIIFWITAYNILYYLFRYCFCFTCFL